MSRDRCDTCGRPIVWARHERTGKAAPIDAMPDPEGNIVLHPGGTYRVLTKAEQAGDPVRIRTLRYVNHWVTCPDRDARKGVVSR